MKAMNLPTESQKVPLLNRREAIRFTSALLGGLFAGGGALLTALEDASASDAAIPGDFTAEQIAFLDEIAETILPATQTPGAKAAKTGAFVALMVTDAYSPAEQRVFRDGMHEIQATMKREHGTSFMQATPEQRLALLTTLDQDAKRVMDARKPEQTGDAVVPAHYFRMMKELALLGFFTSEIGYTQVQRYAETPGRFDPCIPYSVGQPAWAAHA
jgi:hypothetical protein